MISDQIVAMLMTQEKFAGFLGDREVADAGRSAQLLLALSASSRDEVDRVVEAGLAAGGRAVREPQDHGCMYGRAVADPDGRVWEWVWMDPSAVG